MSEQEVDVVRSVGGLKCCMDVREMPCMICMNRLEVTVLATIRDTGIRCDEGKQAHCSNPSCL